MNIYKDGEKVKGLYYGVKYTGIVKYGRPHTMNDSYLHFIDLDTPITVFGAEREGIVLTTGGENTIEAADYLETGCPLIPFSDKDDEDINYFGVICARDTEW